MGCILTLNPGCCSFLLQASLPLTSTIPATTLQGLHRYHRHAIFDKGMDHTKIQRRTLLVLKKEACHSLLTTLLRC